jgi:hypothetical protein
MLAPSGASGTLSVAFRSVNYLKQIFKPNQQNFEYASTVAICSSKTKSSTQGEPTRS